MAGEDVKAMVADVIQRWHADLYDAKVKIGILMAANPKEGEAAVKHAGYPAFATITIVPLKDRVSKGYDAEMVIDADGWKNFSLKHKTALLDHELSHLVVKRAKVKDKKKGDDDLEEHEDALGTLEAVSAVSAVPAGEVILDDIGRPVLKTRKGDWNSGDGFRDVAARHGGFSIEVLNHRQVQAVVEQYMPKDELDAATQ